MRNGGESSVASATAADDLDALVEANEEWLVQRILAYARQTEFTRYTSTLAAAWRASISGLSEALTLARAASAEPLELRPDETYRDDPAAAFGVEEARLHRTRGVSLPMFLGLMKYYRQSYLDLVDEAAREREQRQRWAQYITRFFDRIEIAFVAEWTAHSEDAKLAELQRRSRLLANEKNRYLTVFESLDLPVLLLDETGALENLNHAASALLFGRDASGEMYYRPDDDHVVPAWLREELAEHAGDDDWRLTRAVETEGGKRYLQVRVKRMLDVSEKFRGTVVMLEDVTDRAEAERQLRHLATHDPLTGAVNRYSLDDLLAREVHRTERYGRRLGVMMLDVDRFKEINDTCGHPAGDAILVAIAGLLREQLRASDLVVRYGGDEFLVLLMETDDEALARTERRIREAVRRWSEQHRPAHIPVVLSIGTSVWIAGDEGGIERAIAEADRRMYDDKSATDDDD